MTDRILRWGLLGTARINAALIKPLRMSARNVLAAVASRDAARAQAYAAEWSIPRWFPSYEALLADPEIDAIYISLPNSLHVEWTIKAAQAGKHVLCEKPLALVPEDVDAIATAADRAGVVIVEAFMYRHHPQTLKVQELVAEGAIGRLHLVRGSFTFNLARPNDIRLRPELGGGSIWDVGCYPISYARAVVGAEPVEVFGWQVAGPTGVDLAFVGQMRFPEDVLAQFDSGFRSTLRMVMEFVGDQGRITLTNAFKPDANSQLYLRRGDAMETLHFPDQELYLGEVEDMADAILLGKKPRVSLADSRGNIATIQALLRSAQEGQPVKLF